MRLVAPLFFLAGALLLLSACALGIPRDAASPLLGALLMAIGLLMRIASDLSKMLDGRAAPNTRTHVRCPDCREFVFADASRCPHCRCALIPKQ